MITAKKKEMIAMLLAGLLTAALAPFHFFAFPAAYLIVLFQVVAARFWTMRGWRKDAVRFLLPGLPGFERRRPENRLRSIPSATLVESEGFAGDSRK